MSWAARVELVVAAAALTVGGQLPAQTVEELRIREDSTQRLRLELVEVGRVGSKSGSHDSFGRLMDVEVDHVGRLLAADGLKHQLTVFRLDGSFIAAIGKEGDGPGEFRMPAVIAVDALDTVFVWDLEAAKISVLSPGLAFVRRFDVNPAWLVNGMKVLSDGRLLLSAYAPGERGVLQILSPQGDLERSFGLDPSAHRLGGFEASLLGGAVDANDSTIVYSNKSPYVIEFYSSKGTLQRRCVGDSSWTTRPEDVVEVRGGEQTLHWDRYVASSRILMLPGHLYLNIIVDLMSGRRTLDLVTADCRLLRRAVISSPVLLTRSFGGKFVAVRNIDYPEIVIYEARWSGPTRVNEQ